MRGCGIRLAYRLSTKSTLGEDLYFASRDLSDAELFRFLVEWRNKLRHHLLSDPEKILGRRYPAVAQNVTHDFPSLIVLHQYLRPVTSWSDGNGCPDTSQWGLGKPDLAALADWCEKYFSWGSSDQLLRRFRDKVWPGICIRYLLKVSNIFVSFDSACFLTSVAVMQVVKSDLPFVTYNLDNGTNGEISRENFLHIQQAKPGPVATSTGHQDVPGYVIIVGCHSLGVSSISGLPIHIPHSSSLIIGLTISVWIPSAIVERALSELIESSKSLSHPSQSRLNFEPLPKARNLFCSSYDTIELTIILLDLWLTLSGAL